MVFCSTLQGTEAEAERQQSCQSVSYPAISKTKSAERWELAAESFSVSVAGGLFLAGVIAAAGSDGHFAVSGGAGIDTDSAISADGLGSGRFVSDGVLISDVASYSAADGVNFVQGAGKKGNASVRSEIVSSALRARLWRSSPKRPIE